MSDTGENLEQTEEVVEEVAESPGQEVEYGADVLEYMQRRQADLNLNAEESAEEDAQEGEGEEVQEAASEEETPEAEPVESSSRSARRLLAKESKLRAERTAFAAEREQWQSETKEAAAEVAAFKESKANATINPVAHLTEVGLSEDDLMDVAREIFYKFYPDNATPGVQAEMAAIQRERRIHKLEKAQQKEPEPEQQGPTPEYQAYEANYRAGLTQAAATIDVEAFPLTAAYAKQDFNDLVQGMYNAAVKSAQTNNTGQDLTPEECLGIVEEYLEAQKPQAEADPAPTQTEEKPTPKRKAPLRNKTQAAQPNEKHDDDLSYEEIKAKAQRNFNAKMQEVGFFK